jgi:hypothetical protein
MKILSMILEFSHAGRRKCSQDNVLSRRGSKSPPPTKKILDFEKSSLCVCDEKNRYVKWNTKNRAKWVSDFRRDVDENPAVLGYCSAYSG